MTFEVSVFVLWGGGNIPCSLLVLLVGLTIIKLTQEKITKFNCVCTYGGVHMGLRCHLELKRKVRAGSGIWFGTPKGKKATHTEMDKQKFGKCMFAGPS